MLTRIKRIKFADKEQYVIEYCIDANEWNFIINEDNDFVSHTQNQRISVGKRPHRNQIKRLAEAVHNDERCF